MKKNKQSSKIKLLAIATALVMFAVILPFARIYPAQIPSGWTEVKTAADLKTALTDSTTTQIMFSANIEVPSGGIVINAQKPSLVIDGNGFKLTDFTSSFADHTIRLTYAGTLNSITVQNMKIVGRNNSYGNFYTGNLSDITVIYKDIDFSGPYLSYNFKGTTRIIDSYITMIPGTSPSVGCVALANKVYLEGNTTIVKEQPFVDEPLFCISEDSGAITIAKDADIKISNNINNKTSATLSGFSRFIKSGGSLHFEDDSNFTYSGNNVFIPKSLLNKVSVGKNAKVNINTYGSTNGNPILSITGIMDVNENSVLDIRAYDNNNAQSLIQVQSFGSLNFNAPKDVFLYNSSTTANNTGLVFNAYKAYNATINFNDVESINTWKLNSAAPNNLSNSTVGFVNKNKSPFDAIIGMQNNDASSVVAWDYYGDTTLNLSNFALKDTNVLRLSSGGSTQSAPQAVPAGWTEVKNIAEFKAALTDETTTQIMFGANIEIPSQGIIINQDKPSLIIDGNGYRLTEYGSSRDTDTIRLVHSGNLKDITIQNIDILGRNDAYSGLYVGKYNAYGANVSGVTVTYNNIRYTGPFLSYNAKGTTYIIDSDITLIPGSSSYNTGYVAVTNKVYLEGNTTIIKDQPYVNYSMFYLNEENAVMTISKDANVRISNNRNGNNNVKKSGFVSFGRDDGYLHFAQDSKFSYTGNNLFTDNSVLNRVLIDDNARVNITTYGTLSTNLGIMAVSNIMDVNQGAFLDIRAFDNTASPALLQPRGYGTINFNTPKEVFIYNISTAKNNTGLAIGPFEQKDDVVFNKIQSIEYWHMNTAAPDALPAATRMFVNTDGTPFSGTLVTSATAVISAVARGYNGTLPFTVANTEFKDINVIRILGEPQDPIKDEATIFVTYQDADTGAELDKETFYIPSGNYGPYIPKQEIINNNVKYVFKELLNTSDPESGTVKAGGIVNIIFTYVKENTDSDLELEGIVLWEDDNNKYNRRPANVSVDILQNGTLIHTVQVDSFGNGMFNGPAGLEQYAPDGSEYVYTIAQNNIPLYTTTITGTLSSGFVITNTLSDSLIEIEGIVLWDDDNNRGNTRPDFVSIVLFRNGLAVGATSVSSSSDGKFVFNGLEKYDPSGIEYTYTVNQFPIADYITEVDKYTITNILMR